MIRQALLLSLIMVSGVVAMEKKAESSQPKIIGDQFAENAGMAARICSGDPEIKVDNAYYRKLYWKVYLGRAYANCFQRFSTEGYKEFTDGKYGKMGLISTKDCLEILKLLSDYCHRVSNNDNDGD